MKNLFNNIHLESVLQKGIGMRGYFPTQKFLKMLLRTSLGVI